MTQTLTTAGALAPGTTVALPDGTVIEVKDLATHEKSAIEHFVRSFDEAALAYEELAIIYYSNLWVTSGVGSWDEYVELFGDKLEAANSTVSASKSTVQQRLRDFARFVLFAQVNPRVALRLSPSVSNRLQRIAKPYTGWVRRGEETEGMPEGSIREWASPEVRRNVADLLGVDEEATDQSLLRGLVEHLAVMPSPKEAHRLLDEEVFAQDPNDTDIVYVSRAKVGMDGSVSVHYTWAQVRSGENVASGQHSFRLAPAGTPDEIAQKLAERFKLSLEYES